MKRKFKVVSAITCCLLLFPVLSSFADCDIKNDRINLFNMYTELKNPKQIKLIFDYDKSKYNPMTVFLAFKIIDNFIMKEIGVYKEGGGASHDCSIDKSGDIKSAQDQWGGYLFKACREGVLNNSKESLYFDSLLVNCVDEKATEKLQKFVEDGFLKKSINNYKLTEEKIKLAFLDILDRIDSRLLQLNMSLKSVEERLNNRKELEDIAKRRFENVIVKVYKLENRFKELYKQVREHLKKEEYRLNVGKDIMSNSMKDLKDCGREDEININVGNKVFKYIESFMTRKGDIKKPIVKLEPKDIEISKDLVRDIKNFIKDLSIKKCSEDSEMKTRGFEIFEISDLPFIKNLKVSGEEVKKIKSELIEELKRIDNLKNNYKEDEKKYEEVYNIGLGLVSEQWKDLTKKEKNNKEVIVRKGIGYIEEISKAIKKSIEVLGKTDSKENRT